MPILVISMEGASLRPVLLVKDRTTMGRRPYNDIVMDNLAVSGEHAVFHQVGGDVYLEDLNSTNGTYVNGRAIQKHLLADDDLIEVARYKIRYLVSNDVPATPSVTRPAPLTMDEVQPFSGLPTEAATLGGAQGGFAIVRILTGAETGREIVLEKVVTTIGKPGAAVVAITRRFQSYMVTPVDGGTLLNGKLLGADAVPLRNGDIVELAGKRMQFIS